MKNLKLSILVISILIGGTVGCQRNQPSPFALKTNSVKAANLSQLQPEDIVKIDIVYVGYNESPATDSSIYLGASLSTSSTSGLGSNPLPTQVELRKDYESQVAPYSTTGAKGAKFEMQLTGRDLQTDMAKLNSDLTKPIYLNWTFTPAKGGATDLYSIDLSDRISSAFTDSSSDVVQDSMAEVQREIALFTTSRSDTGSQQSAEATAKVMENLLLTSSLAKIYPLVDEIDSTNINSFSYVGLSVSVVRGH